LIGMSPKETKHVADKIQRALSNTEINGWEMEFLGKLETRLCDETKDPKLSQIFEKCGI
jgi:hypothetical protein